MEARSQSAAHPNEMNFIFNLNAFSWKTMRLTGPWGGNFGVLATDPARGLSLFSLDPAYF
jgi:hypothetical protein